MPKISDIFKKNQKPRLLVRYLKKDEAAWVREFTYQSLYVAPGETPFDRSILDLPEILIYYKDFDPVSSPCIVCMADETCTGMVWSHNWGHIRKTNRFRGYGYYRDDYPELSLAVLPEYRHQGIGKLLLQKYIEEARNVEAIPGLSLSVSYGNDIARAMYEKEGFRVVEKRETDILMVLELHSFT